MSKVVCVEVDEVNVDILVETPVVEVLVEPQEVLLVEVGVPGPRGPPGEFAFITKVLSEDLTVPADSALLTVDLLILDGVSLTIEDTGEVLTL